MGEKQLVVVTQGSAVWHKPSWMPGGAAPASYRLGSACGLDVVENGLLLRPKGLFLRLRRPCRKCYRET